MKEISVSDFKARCLSVFDELGPEGIVVTRHGKPIARVVPADSGRACLMGSMEGKLQIKGDTFSTGVPWNAE